MKNTIRESILRKFGHDNEKDKKKEDERQNRVSISDQVNIFKYSSGRLTENSELLISERKSLDNNENLLPQ